MRSSFSQYPLVSETEFSFGSSNSFVLDSLIGECEEQALNVATLFSMTASSAAYKLTKCLSSAGLSSVLSSQHLIKLVTGFTALSTEVFSFETSSRICGRFTQPTADHLFDWEGEQGFRKGLLHGFISFGSLRLVPHSIQSIFIQHLLQDSAMVASHHLESICFGSARPEGSVSWQFLHAEMTLLQLQTGMAFFNRLSGHTVQRAERNIEFKAGLSSQRTCLLTNSSELLLFHRLDDNPQDLNNPTRILLRRFQSGDRKAEQELMREGMALLYSYVRRYAFARLDDLDLMQEASIAFFKEAKAFDVEGPKPFFLKYEILGALRKFVRKNISDVVLSNYKHEQLYALKRVMDAFEHEGVKPEIEEIALALKCSPERVLELTELNLLLTKTNLEDQIGESRRRVDTIASQPATSSRVEVGENEIQEADPALLGVFLEVIGEQEAKIFRERLLHKHPTPVHVLARNFNIDVDELAQLEKEISEAFVLFQRFSRKCPIPESLPIHERALLTRVRAGVFRRHLGETGEFERFAFVNFEAYLQLGLIPKRVDHRLRLLRWLSGYVTPGGGEEGWSWLRENMGKAFVREFWQPRNPQDIETLDAPKMRSLFSAVYPGESTVGKIIEWQVLWEKGHIASSTPFSKGQARQEPRYAWLVIREYEAEKYELLRAEHQSAGSIVERLRASCLSQSGFLRIPSDGWLALRVMKLQDIPEVSKRDIDCLFEDVAKKNGIPLEELNDLVWQFNLFREDKIVAPRAYLPGTEVVSSELCSILFHRESSGRYEIRRAYPARVNRVLDAFEESEFYRSEELNIRQGGWLGYRAFNVSDFMELRESDVQAWIAVLAKRLGMPASRIKEFVLETNILKSGDMMWPQPLLPSEANPSGVYYKIHFKRRREGGFIISFGGRSRGRSLNYFLGENELVRGSHPVFEVNYSPS